MPTPARTRTDACPGVVSPHLAADGALARIRLPGGVVGAGPLRAVAELADDAGDGAVHLTSRGNLQLRGLDPGDPRPVARLAAAGLLPSTTHERVRNVLASPLSGIAGGLADVRGLAGLLDAGLCARPALADLPGRFLIALDDGRADVAGERPDLCWVARSAARGELVVAGTGTGLTCAPADAPGLLLDAAEVFRTLRHAHAADPAARAWRASELPNAAARIAHAFRDRPSRSAPADTSAAGRALRNGGPDDHVATLGVARPARSGPHRDGNVPLDETVPPTDGRVSRSGPRPDGNVPLDGTGPAGPAVGALGGGAVGAAPVLGELSSAQLRTLADLAPELLVTPWRTLVLPAPHDPSGVLDALRDAGLVVDPDHPALRVSACAGAPGCAKSLADVRGHARELIRLGTGRAVHVTGCGRRCGAPHTPHADAVATGPASYEIHGLAQDLREPTDLPEPTEEHR